MSNTCEECEGNSSGGADSTAEGAVAGIVVSNTAYVLVADSYCKLL
jgi:hypothetical protein